MTFASRQDALAIEAEMPWTNRDLPKTVFEMLSDTAKKFPQRPAVSYQLLSGPKDKSETLTWAQLQGKVAQAANLFRTLGIG